LAVFVVLCRLWPMLRRRDTPGSWPSVMRIFTAISAAIAAGAVIANTIGMVRLSLLSVQFVLYSYYAAVTIRGTVSILTGMVVAALRTDRFSTVEFTSNHRPELERQAVRVLNLAGIIAFIAAVLFLTTLLDPFRSNLNHLLGVSLSVGAISISLQNILAFIVTVLVAFVISNAIRVALELSAYQHLKLSIGQKERFSKLLHYLILFLGFLIAFGAAGLELSKVAILAGGLSVGVGLGLQGVVNNFVSGLILLFERPLQVGDIVSVGKVEGQVKNIGIRASTIRNGEGADVIVPNATLITGELTNWTHLDSIRRVSITVTMGQDVQPNRIVDILTGIAKRHEMVMPAPTPTALLTGFNNGLLEFSLAFWCDARLWGGITSEVRTHLVEAFHEAGVTIPFFDQNLRVTAPSTHAAAL
jgi:potassium-dependent mechanosensitive channel